MTALDPQKHTTVFSIAPEFLIPAPATPTEPGTLGVGTNVRVTAQATNAPEKKYIGRRGQIVAQVGPECWDVQLPMGRKGSGLYERKSFMAGELEVA